MKHTSPWRLLAAAVPALTLALSSLTQAAEGWGTNFEAAKTEAAKDHKDILMDFTGSDWCGWCIKLRDEVFTKDAFKQEAPKHFVLLELDFPQKKELPKEEKEQNEKMQAMYAVEGFPTIFLTDAKGRPYGKTGYQKGGPEEYNKHLDELRKIRETRDASFKLAEGASGMEKAKAIKDGLDALDKDLVVPFYKEEMEQIISLDTEDKLGFKAQKELTEKRSTLDKELKELAMARKPAEFSAAIDAFIEKEKMTGTAKQDLLMTKLQVMGPDDLDKADAILDDVIKVDDKSELAGQAKAIKGRIVQMRQKAKAEPAGDDKK